MTRKQTIKRNAEAYLKNASPRHTFTSICNNLLQSVVVADGKPVMSLDTMGFVAFMLSQEVHWKLHLNWAKQKLQIGDRVLKRIFRESKAAGFSKVERDKDAEGRYTGSVTYYFTDIPFSFADGKAISDETSPMGETPASISDEIHKGRFATNGEMYPPYKEKKEDRKNKQNRNTLTSFECTGAEAREEPVEVDFQEIKKALPAQRKAAKREIAVTLSRKRQPDLPMAVDPQRTMLDAQVEEGLRLWKEAMGDLWAGIRVSKTQKSQMRSLIQAEGFEYVQALGEALKTMQFGRGQNGGWILELCDLLNKEDKRQAVFSKYQRASHAVPSAFRQNGSAAQPDRFEEGKIVIDVHGCLVKGEDANDILDAVDGATRDMVRKALKAASGKSQGSLVGYGEKKPSLDAVSRWCEATLRQEVAITKHGTPEQLCGGNVAKLGEYELKFDAGAISQPFLDSLRAKYPNAWVVPCEFDAWGEQVHRQPAEDRLWRAFCEVADRQSGGYLAGGSRLYNWTAYGPGSQAKLEADFEEAVKAESELVSSVLQRIAEGQQRARNSSFDWSQMQYLGSCWHLPPQIKGAVCNAFNIPMDALNRCLRTLEGTLSPVSAGRQLESMLGGAA